MTSPRIPEFIAFISERHRMYQRRKNGDPAPWTDDPALRDYRFCNVFRELDTVTVWIDENIRQPFADHENLWIMLAIARYVNWPPTLDYLINEADGAWPTRSDWKPEDLTKGLTDFGADGKKVYTGAYMIRPERYDHHPWFHYPKHKYIAEIVIGNLWAKKSQWEKLLQREDLTLHDTFNYLVKFHGWGGFMAYEVVTDMRHTRYLKNAQDIYLWANAGIGAMRGLNRVYGRHVQYRLNQSEANTEMFLLMKALNADIPEVFADEIDRFEMRDIEHSLCEFDKYERIIGNEGKIRNKYNWRKHNV